MAARLRKNHDRENLVVHLVNQLSSDEIRVLHKRVLKEKIGDELVQRLEDSLEMLFQ